MLDEMLAILRTAWSGERVHHHGEHYTVDGRDVRADAGARLGAGLGRGLRRATRRPIRRAVRHDGYFPVNVTSSDQLAEIVAAVREQLGDDRTYDVAAEPVPGRDPAPYAAAGATWTLTDLRPRRPHPRHVRGVVRDGPPA